MKQKINIFTYFICLMAFVFADKISSSANKIQVDYNDIKYDIRGRDFNADLALRKLLFSATRSDFNFNTRNESASLVTGPSKLNIQGLDFNVTTEGRRGIERLDFSIGNLSFDINKCNIQLIDNLEQPRINFFDSRLNMSNISLDLSYFTLDRDIEEFLRDSNVRLNKITVNQATGSMKYDESDKLRINLNGFTSLGNFKVDIIGTIDERDFEDSQFEKFNIQISNISSDLKKMIKKYEMESGEKLEIKNGVLNIDVKERLEESFNPNFNDTFRDYREDWPDREISRLLRDCMKDESGSMGGSREMCECAVDVMVAEFTYEEYLLFQSSMNDKGGINDRLDVFEKIVECFQSDD